MRNKLKQILAEHIARITPRSIIQCHELRLWRNFHFQNHNCRIFIFYRLSFIILNQHSYKDNRVGSSTTKFELCNDSELEEIEKKAPFWTSNLYDHAWRKLRRTKNPDFRS